MKEHIVRNILGCQQLIQKILRLMSVMSVLSDASDTGQLARHVDKVTLAEGALSTYKLVASIQYLVGSAH
ncbi:hypothetical protein LZG71_28815 [Dyadobacter sp. CY312]|nr:hypothetical protein [Dyadobacter sp. CY312]